MDDDWISHNYPAFALDSQFVSFLLTYRSRHTQSIRPVTSRSLATRWPRRMLHLPTRTWLGVLLAFYLLASGGYSVVNPIFEAPDEHHHYFAARYIAAHWQLPVAQAGTPYRQEGAQPPLYYLLAATLTLPWPASPAAGDLALNPEAHTGVKGAENNFNLFLHPAGEDWPWRGDALLVHLQRFFSVLLGAGSLLCLYATARRLWPNRPRYALLAVAAVAGLPQWLFLHSAITNDTLLIFLVALSHCYLTYLWFTPVRLRHYWLLGVLIALAILTKNTGLLLLPYTALFLLAKQRWRLNRPLVSTAAAVAIPVLLLTTWLFWRNWQLYGDPTALNQFVALGGGERQLPAWFILQHLDLLWLSTVAFFGWMNVLAPAWVFVVWVALLISATLGALFGLLRGARIARSMQNHNTGGGIVALQTLWPLLVFAAWFQFNLRTPAEQGRLLFPAILPLALWVGYGLGQWRPRLLPAAALVATMTTALYCLAVVMPAAYPRLKLMDALPGDAAPLNQPMGLGIELVAAQTHTPQLHPGDSAHFTLYWRATEPISEPPLVTSEIWGRGLRPVGSLDAAYHGGGMFPANTWPPGATVAEDLHIAIAQDAHVPTLGRLYLRLEGQEALVNAGVLKLVPRQWPAASPTPIAELANGIAIAQATVTTTTAAPGMTLPVHVRWQVSQRVAAPLNTFVHLGQPGQPPLAQGDGPALGGDYPALYWEAGEVFDDEYLLTLPANLPFGEYAVMIGLYNTNSGERILLSVKGERQPADALVVAWISVANP